MIRKFTDTQILNKIERQIKQEINFNTQKTIELGKRKLKLVKQRNKLRKQMLKYGWEFQLNEDMITKSFDNIQSETIKHNVVVSHADMVLNTIKQMRKALK